jgi:hypothetical protein
MDGTVHDGFPWWLRPFLMKGVVAITLGKNIWLRKGMEEEAREHVLVHERVHVRQQAELGVLRFLVRYLFEYFRNRLVRRMSAAEAYRRISFEEEAFAAEGSETV